MALIGPAPEFGSDGAPPPLETAPILQGEEFYVTETAQRQDETSPREALKEVLSRKWDESEHRDLFALKEWFRLNYNFYPDLKITDARAIAIIGKREARRFRLFEFWRRDDPVVQLPPGVTAKITKTLSVGLTETRARELSSSIGLSGANLGIGELTARVSGTLSDSQALTRQHASSNEFALSNSSNDCYRLYAVWHKVSRIEVQALQMKPWARDSENKPYGRHNVPWWVSTSLDELILDDAIFLTMGERKI